MNDVEIIIYTCKKQVLANNMKIWAQHLEDTQTTQMQNNYYSSIVTDAPT